MSPDIFINDFERTEYSDLIHGVIGRSLILATRFDSMCVNLALAMDIKFNILVVEEGEENFSDFIDKIISKNRTLNNSIQSFKLPENISQILHQPISDRLILSSKQPDIVIC